jgi:tight adherence protein C
MIVGALLGLVFGAGLVIAARNAPPMRPIRLVDRIGPYLGDAPAPSRLLAHRSSSAMPFVVVRRLVGPFASDAIRLLDRTLGGASSIRRRLRGLASESTVEEFRIEQIVWATLGLIAGGVGTAAVTAARGGVEPILVGVAALVGLAAGVLGRDWWLGQQLARRESAMLAEFPVVADLLALAVIAGEAPGEALARVCRLTGGELAHDLDGALAQVRSGTPMTKALAGLAEATTLEPFSRFLVGLVVAIERGTPLADVLRAQAMDVREAGKRALLEAGGRKEISMMFPVVFLILPITVLFALYPGLLTLVSITQ